MLLIGCFVNTEMKSLIVSEVIAINLWIKMEGRRNKRRKIFIMNTAMSVFHNVKYSSILIK